jgi:hypothetical protein
LDSGGQWREAGRAGQPRETEKERLMAAWKEKKINFYDRKHTLMGLKKLQLVLNKANFALYHVIV